jgi:hypothetical protein
MLVVVEIDKAERESSATSVDGIDRKIYHEAADDYRAPYGARTAGAVRGVAGALQQCVSLVWKVSNTRRTLTCRGMVKRILRNRPRPDAIED